MDIRPYADVAGYDQQVTSAGHATALVDAACRFALSQKSVAHITCPVDLQEQTLSQDEPSKKKAQGQTSSAWTPPTVVPGPEES